MKFGVFDHMDASGLPLRDFFENRLRLAEAYDRIGIHALHIAEHHGTPLGLSPAPSVFLSAVAQRTRRLRFGPLVYTLPLYHPLRLVEEICILDQLSGGRLELGVGRGVSPFEFGYMGVDLKQSQGMYFEAYQIILKALASRTLTFEGEHYRFRDSPIVLEPVQKPHPPLWYGVSNPESTEWAAQNGLNAVSNSPADVVRGVTDRYRAEWASRGKDPKRMPLVGMTRHVVIAGTDREAVDSARRAYGRWYENFALLWRANNVPLPRTVFYTEDFERMLEGQLVIAGSPQTVRDALAAQAAQAGVNYLLMRFAFGDLSLDETLRSVELFAKQVMPALAAVPAPVT